MVTATENDRGNPNVLVVTAHRKYSLIINTSDLNQTKVLKTNTIFVLCTYTFTFFLFIKFSWIVPRSPPPALKLEY